MPGLVSYSISIRIRYNTPMKVIIICESLRIGGIERLTLDQSYQLNTLGIENEIILIGKVTNNNVPTFAINESELIIEKAVKYTEIPGRRIDQINKLRKIINRQQDVLIVSHSLRGTVLVWLIRLFTRQDFKIFTTIHQLSSLSAPVQRLKRYFYSQFTDKLFFFSIAAINDWIYNQNFFVRAIANRKDLTLLRNGVFLPRIIDSNPVVESNKNERNRLIFIGRLTTWKGLEIFLNLSKINLLNEYDFLLITPTNPSELFSEFDAQLLSRFNFEIGKSISQIKFKSGDIHVYPANYGSKNMFIEGISINVLEMACLGIPSLVTIGGSNTWPELLDLGIVKEVDWSNLSEVADCIIKLSTSRDVNKINECLGLIDIRNNINTILNS